MESRVLKSDFGRSVVSSSKTFCLSSRMMTSRSKAGVWRRGESHLISSWPSFTALSISEPGISRMVRSLSFLNPIGKCVFYFVVGR